MQIRRLEGSEIAAALRLVREVFDEQTAPGYSEEGRASFYQFIEEERIRSLLDSRQVFFIGCVEQGRLYGCSMADTGGHICLLFVHPSCQRQGWGRQLVEAVCQECVRAYALTRITVNAAPAAVEFYHKCGFWESLPQQSKDGIIYYPMERMYSAADHAPERTGNRKMLGFLVGGILGVLVLLGIVLFLVGKNAVEQVETAAEEQRQQKEEEEFQSALEGRIEDEEYSENGEEEIDDFDRMEAYIASDLDFRLTEETYELNEENEQEHLEFLVHYPQLKNLPGNQEETVNQVLRDAAMASVDQFYLEPSQELQEYYADEENVYLGSEVEYKVTYLSNDLISVAFSDHYFAGHWAAEFLDLRTRIVNLKTGDVYRVEDVLQPDDEFAEIWRTRMLEHEPASWALRELPTDTFRRVLEGEVADSRYTAGILLTKDGIELGFTYHFRSEDGDRITRGWQIGGFSPDEIKNEKKDHEMWNLVESDD